jgi:hypothetical protein
VVAGTATAVSNRVSRRQPQPQDQQPPQYEQQPQYAPPPQQDYAPPPAPDPIEQLTKLAALKEQGILTDAEFVAQKAKILAQT